MKQFARNQEKSAFHFGAFELDPHSGELRKHGIKIKLQHQPLQILTILLERPGEVVTREEIQKRLWPDDTYVDFENAINSAMRKLRDALGDTAENPRFIETLARRGYRFIYPISGGVRTLPVEVPKVQRKRHRLWWLALGGSAALAAGIAFWIANSGNEVIGPPAPPVPLTSYAGFERYPSFSPEGTRIAFSWNEPGKRPSNIYVKMIGPGDPVRLTTSPTQDFAPAWSPDGRSMAFLRVRDPFHSSVMTMSALGGQQRDIADITTDVGTYNRFFRRMPVPAPFLTWSPDGKWLLAVDQADPGAWQPHHVIRISVETGEKRTLTFPPRNALGGDGGLALSSDGKTLAFTRAVGIAVNDIYTVPMSNDLLPAGEPRRITFDAKAITGLAWTANSRDLLFTSTRDGRLELWQTHATPHSEPVRLTATGDDPVDIAVSREGHRLVYAHIFGDFDISRIALEGEHAGESETFISSTKDERHPKYSPDGKRIVFESKRSGSEEIWVANEDGSDPIQLTSFGKAWAGSPRWSPDGQKIAFDCNAAGHWDIYVVNFEGGKPVRLTISPASDIRPSWSRDGNWIYFTSNRTGMFQIWKLPAGGGHEVQLTKSGGYVAFESADGQTLYYSKAGDLWQMPARGGTESKFLAYTGTEFDPRKNGVYFIDSRDEHLKLFDFSAHAVKTIATLSDAVSDELAVSPDERRALYLKEARAGSELMLVENFR